MSLQRFYPVRAGPSRPSKGESQKKIADSDDIITSTQICSNARVKLADLSFSPVSVVNDSPIVSSATGDVPEDVALLSPVATSDLNEIERNAKSDNINNDNNQDENNATATQSCVDECDLKNWGLYPDVLRWYQDRKIEKMFPWQRDCLKSEGVLAGRSLVFSAPTSAGKTMVADILMIKQAYENRKKVLVILPFISIIREKMLTLQSMLKSTHLKVGGFMGQHHTPGGFDKVNIAICTVEKANNYVLKLLREHRLDEIGAIVVDEVHTISESRRGVILELLLSKVMMYKKKHNSKIQIIAMSATLPNVPSLASWLDAAVYQTDFRPVELKETIMLDRKIHDAREMKVLYEISEKQCPDMRGDSIYLTVKSVIEKQKVLIFYNNKEKCEQLARNISLRIRDVGSKSNPAGQRVKDFIKQEEVTQVLHQLDSCLIKADDTLKHCAMFGVAFHHGGLCMEHRAIIEEAFRSGLLKVLVATSTLSSGVNLPARVVIIQTPLFGNKMMDPLTYRQMIGRAGRKGIDEHGESILLCNKEEMQLGVQLVTSETPPVRSSISDSSSAFAEFALQKAILEAVSIDLAKTHEEILMYLSSTFYFSSADEETRQSYQVEAKKALDYLIRKHFIENRSSADTDSGYEVSQLGKACIAASIYPQEALRLLETLNISSYGLFVRNDLHLLFLIIPDSTASNTTFSAEHLRRVIESWHRDASTLEYTKVAEILKIDYLKVMSEASEKFKNTKINKFFLAVALNDIIKEVPIHELECKYGISKAVLQNLQNNSAAFASMVSSFCRELGWESFQLLIDNLQTRLEFGVKQELVNLMRIPCLNARLARSLYKADLDTVIQVANADTNEILKAISAGKVYVTSPEKHAQTRDRIWIESRKMSMTLAEVSHLIRSEAREIALEQTPMNWVQSAASSGEPSASTSETAEPQVFRTPNKRQRSNTRARTRNGLRKGASTRVSRRIDDQALSCSIEDTTVTSSSGSSQETACQEDSFSTPKKKLKRRPDNALSPGDEMNIIDCSDEASSRDVINLWTQYKRMSIHFALRKVRLFNGAIGQKMGAPAPSAAANTQAVVDNRTVEAAYISFGGPKVYLFSDPNAITHLSTAMKEQLESNCTHLEIIVDKVLLVYNILRIIFDLPRKLLTKILWFDLRIACWFDDPEAPQPSLPDGYICRYLKPFVESLQAIKNKCSDSSVQYYAFTASIMIELASHLSSHVLSQGRMMHSFREIEMKASLVLAECSLHGFLIDRKYLQELSSQLVKMEKQLTSKAYAISSEQFNLGSPHEVAKILYHKFNLLEVASGIIDSNPHRIRKIKESRKLPDHLKTGRRVLEKLSQYHELPKVIHEHRSVTNVLCRTISPLNESLKKREIKDDVVVPKFELFTATGRVAMYDPDLMKTPRTFTALEKLVNVRKLFTARPGFTLVSADYSQLEMRVLAHLSKDAQLTDSLNSGHDVFRELASRIDSCFVDDVTDERRQQAKGISYGIIYGMGLRELSKRLEVSEEEAGEIRDCFLKTLQRINPFIQETVEKLRETQYIETIGGRRRMLPAIASRNADERSKAKRQAINSTIQGSAADIAKAAMCKVDRAIEEAGIEAYLTLEMHDELIYQVRCESLNVFAAMLSQSMQQVTHDLFPDFQVKLSVNVKTGHNWGEMSTLDADAFTKATDSSLQPKLFM